MPDMRADYAGDHWQAREETSQAMTPDEIHEADEREAIRQEGSGLPIEIVTRNPQTGELIQEQMKGSAR
jgi:hypothetical protein